MAPLRGWSLSRAVNAAYAVWAIQLIEPVCRAGTLHRTKARGVNRSGRDHGLVSPACILVGNPSRSQPLHPPVQLGPKQSLIMHEMLLRAPGASKLSLYRLCKEYCGSELKPRVRRCLRTAVCLATLSRVKVAGGHRCVDTVRPVGRLVCVAAVRGDVEYFCCYLKK
jgi:hypothetical protein